jgi:hypothetical protein
MANRCAQEILDGLVDHANDFQAVMGSRYQLTDPKLQGIDL